MNTLSSDEELVNILCSDNVEAFDLIYKKYSNKLYSFGLKYLKSGNEAEELVQSVFVKIWENRKKLKKELSFNSYLFTIAYNDICKFYRKRTFQKQFVEDMLIEPNQPSVNLETIIDYQSVLKRVEDIIEMLPEKQKITFRKSKLEGMTTKEIAEELKLTPGTIDNYIFESLKFVRKQIKKEDLMIVLFFALFIL